VERVRLSALGMVVPVTDNPLALFRRAAVVANVTVAAVRGGQLDDPTPCTQWTVRELINHVLTGNLRFVAFATGGVGPDRFVDHVGDDHVASFRDSLRRVTEAFEAPGFLERRVPTPFGEGTGAVVVGLRFNELFVHSWDLAKATGQSTDLDPELARALLASFWESSVFDRDQRGFGTEQSAPAHTTAADRLAAFLGRAV
jgi:uncharacterized protein (TIGR03086 family)